MCKIPTKNRLALFYKFQDKISKNMGKCTNHMTMRPNYIPNTDFARRASVSRLLSCPRTAVGSGVVDLRGGDGAGRRREESKKQGRS